MKKIIGHRGASGYAPENTLAAFDKAHMLGCDFIEFDVMLSGDGEPFIFHDDTLKRTTNGRGDIGLVTADYLRSLDAGSWFSDAYREEKIPSLLEAIEWLTATGVNANIEIKPYPGRVEQTSIAVLKHIHDYWPKDKKLPLISSFDPSALILCRRLDPEIPMGLLCHQWHENCVRIASELRCFSIHLSRRAVTADRVHLIKQHGYEVYVYTVNRKRQAESLFKWGVDAVFSDYPDLLL